MNPELQRIAIAEACGWQHCEINHHSTGMFRKGAVIGTSPDSERKLHIHSYTTDLNAMHEAEKILTQAQDYQYRASVLPAVCKDGSGMIALTATAAQRAEAFLRTLGKWEESQ